MTHVVRVLHVVTHMNRGGLESMLMNYYRHMDRSRVQFDFLVHREIRAAFDDEIEALGGRIHRIGRLIPWSRSYRRTLGTLFRVHPEYRIVHVHQDCLSSVALEEAMKCGIPTRVAHCHSSSQNKDFKYPIKTYYGKRIPMFATKLFACGQEAGEWMFGGATFEVLRNAIPVDSYAFRPDTAVAVRAELGIERNSLVVGHVGRFSPVKNHAFLLDIFASLAEMREDARLLLVGDGELHTRVKEMVRAAGLSKMVTFTGSRSDVHRLLQAMDVFVFPSLYEGLPLALVEAQSAGLPCVISDGVPRESALIDGVSSLSLRESPSVWTKEVLRAAQRPRLHTQGSVVEAGYDISENARRLQQFYLSEDT